MVPCRITLFAYLKKKKVFRGTGVRITIVRRKKNFLILKPAIKINKILTLFLYNLKEQLY